MSVLSTRAARATRSTRSRRRARGCCIYCGAQAAVKVLRACERHLKRDRKRKAKPAPRGSVIKTVAIDFKKRTMKQTSNPSSP